MSNGGKGANSGIRNKLIRAYTCDPSESIQYTTLSGRASPVTLQKETNTKVKSVIQRQSSSKSLFLVSTNPDKAHSPDTKSDRYKITRRKRFANLVSRHILSIRDLFATSHSANIPASANSGYVVSCPDLYNVSHNPFIKHTNSRNPPAGDRSIAVHGIGGEVKQEPDIDISAHAQRTVQLTVPDIFTTSLTRSRPTSKTSVATTDSPLHNQTRPQCHSAQNLQTYFVDQMHHVNVSRSFSDSKPPVGTASSTATSLTDSSDWRSRSRSDSYSSTNSVSNCLQSGMYRDDHVSQVLDYLFIGSVEVAYSEPLLCKLGIESLVDISNTPASQVPWSKKTHCPCLCQSHMGPHFRSRLIIEVQDKDNEDIEQYFSEINRFIDAARKCGKNVLIYSYKGMSRAPAAAIEYLMSHEGLLLRQAYNLVKNQRPSVSINLGFQLALETLEGKLFPDAKPSVSICNEYLNVADPQAIKCAWIDC
jgi:protein-tyrosine phosphatase